MLISKMLPLSKKGKSSVRATTSRTRGKWHVFSVKSQTTVSALIGQETVADFKDFNGKRQTRHANYDKLTENKHNY